MNNQDIYKIMKSTPTYERWMPKITADVFKEAGYREFYVNALPMLTDFFGLMVQVVLNKIKDVNVRIPDFYRAIVEEYSQQNGGISQRIYNEIPKPISPQSFNLEEGKWVNDLVIRTPRQSQAFWKQNFFYANLLTIKEEELQKAFISDNGVAEFVAMKQAGLQKSYVIAKSKLAREVLAGAIKGDGVEAPELKDTQIYNAANYPDLQYIDSDTPTEIQSAYRCFVNILDNIKGIMESSNICGSFNCDGFEDANYAEDHILLMRFDIYNKIKQYESFIGAGTGYLDKIIERLPFRLVLVDGLGKQIFVLKSDHSTQLKPVYKDNTFQYQIGWSVDGGVGELSDCVPEEQIDMIDDNPNTFAALAQRGVIFTIEQSEYRVNVKQAFLGQYYNIIATQPNSQISYDSHYNIIRFSKDGAETKNKK